MFTIFKNETGGERTASCVLIVLLMIGLIWPQCLVSQSYPVSITLAVAPPYTGKVDDYIAQPNKIMATLVNHSGQVKNVFIRGEISGEGGIRIYTDPLFKMPQPLVLMPGIPFQVTRNNLEDIFDADHLKFEGITRNEILYGSGLPEGDYVVCFRAFDYYTGEPLSAEEPLGCSPTFTISDIEPPVVIQPACGSQISALFPQQVVFTWSRPPGAPINTRFNLKIVEVLPSDRTPEDAIFSASRPVFLDKMVDINTYILGPADNALVTGKKYAFVVTAIDPSGKTSFRNKGMSEVCSFDYIPSAILTQQEDTLAKPKPKPKINPKPQTIPWGPLNVNTFKGRLVWAFPRSETGGGGSSIGSAMPQGGTTVVFNNNFAGALPLLEGTTGQQPGSAQGQGNAANIFSILGGGNLNGVGFVNTLPGIQGTAPNPQQQLQNQINALASDERYPLKNTEVELHLILKPEWAQYYHQQQQMFGIPGQSNNAPPSDILLGSTYTDANGDFTLIYNGQIGPFYDLELIVKNPYFIYSGIGIQIAAQENNVYTIGEVLGLAKNYRLKVRVKSEEGGNLDLARVKIYRVNGFYQSNPLYVNLEHEVMRDQLSGVGGGHNPASSGSNGGSSGGASGLGNSWKYGGQNTMVTGSLGNAAQFVSMMELVGEAASGATFQKMFFSQGFSDRYIVAVSLDNGPVQLYDLMVSEQGGTLNQGVPVIEKTYTLQLPNPVVKGRVISKQGGIPLEGVVVTLAPDDASQLSLYEVMFLRRTVKTDKEGRFSIEDIKPRGKPYKLTVKFGSTTYNDPQPLYLASKGIVETRDPIAIDAELITVCGKVVTTQGVPLSGAALHWKSGGDVFFTNAEGIFITSQVPGKHRLIAQMPGYLDAEEEIEVKITQGNSGGYQMINPGNSSGGFNLWQNTAGNSASPGSGGLTLGQLSGSVLGVGQAGSSSTGFANGVSFNQALFNGLIYNGGIMGGNVSCGYLITMQKFYVKVRVTDEETGKPIPQALVQSELSSTPVLTNSIGIALLDDVSSGSAAIWAKGPAGTDYVPARFTLSINSQADTTFAELTLAPGTHASGKVQADGLGMAGARVEVVGKEFIYTTTDAGGSYILRGIPSGSYTLRASKSGFISDDTTTVFNKNQAYLIDFQLTNPGFVATTLLGFDLELDEALPGSSPDEFIITGKLVNIPDNQVFSRSSGQNFSLPFFKQTIVRKGTLIAPKNNEIQTDVSQVELKMYGYLRVRLTSAGGLKVKPINNDTQRGEVMGEVFLDFKGSFPAVVGLKLPPADLKVSSGTTSSIGALRSDGSSPGNTFVLSGTQQGWEIYGLQFVPEFSGCNIQSDGIHLKGKLAFTGIPLLSGNSLKINNITLTSAGLIKDILLEVSPQPVLNLASWKLSISGATLDPYGLKLAGDMDVQVPASPVGKVGFSALGISPTGLTGGNFYLPPAGLSVFDIITVKTKPGASFYLQKVPGQNHYRLMGSGYFNVGKYIAQALDLDYISVSTNGQLAAEARTGYSVNFADLASLTISDIGFNSAVPSVAVGGSFKLGIPGMGAGAGGAIHYNKNSVNVDKLSIGWNLNSSIGMSAEAVFAGNGFTGAGNLSLAGSSGSLGMDFHYYKTSNGKDIGAQFKAGVVIPIGLVKLDELTGGFKCNTATNTYSVNVGGRITLAPDPYGVVALNPVTAEIISAPGGLIFKGSSTVVILNAWAVGHSSMEINFANKYFMIDGQFGTGFNLIKGLSMGSTGGVHLEASVKSGNMYWLVAGNTHTYVAHILDVGATLAAGWNVPKAQSPLLAEIPDYVLSNGRLYGGYLKAYTEIGGKSPVIGYKDIASIEAWYYNKTFAEFYGNFKASAFGFKMGQSWECGGEVNFFGLGLAGADIYANGSLSGYYGGDSYAINGNLSAGINAHVGCDGSCNSITWGCCFNPCWPWSSCDVCPCPCGAKICVNGSLSVGYSSASGWKFNLSL